MSSPAEGNTSVDFFASIVALSSIMLFTKFVTHRTRDRSVKASPRLHIWHVACIVASSFAAGLALIALELENPSQYLHIATAALVAIAAVILVLDGLIDDSKRVRSHGEWRKEIRRASSVEKAKDPPSTTPDR